MFAPSVPGTVVKTLDGSLTLSHEGHGECYHNQAGAETEARELNVKASDFEEAVARAPQAVLDVGLGLGYNAFVTVDAWLASATPHDLVITSFEIDEHLVTALASGSAAWQSNWTAPRIALCRTLQRDGAVFRASLVHPLAPVKLVWTIHVFDARSAPLPTVPSGYSFVWQDPFSPEKNPEMWNGAWFAKVRDLVRPDAVLMTYSVSRAVRDALTASGWRAERIPSRLPPKRQWLRATPA